MSLYNMLFGMNPHSDLLLAVIGLRRHDVERFRDCSVSEDGSEITVYSRTGGGNREDYPNEAMRNRPEWKRSYDDDSDSTYCTDEFTVPEEWREDVRHLGDIFGEGLRRDFGQHLLKTLRRESTDADKAQAAHDAERKALASLPHLMANGHTFVPLSDAAMEAALKLAEANDGKLRSCWGIAPIEVTVKTDFCPCPGAKDKRYASALTRVEIGYEYSWRMDEAYWAHCQERFGAEYPKTMGEIAETVARYQKRTA